MRTVIGGLLGLCLLAALLPAEAHARTDPRGSAQSASSSSRVQAGRNQAIRAPSSTRITASRPAAQAPSRATTSSRAVTTRAGSERQALARRPGQPTRMALSGRGASSRQAAAVPYGRQAAQPVRGLQQTAMASCTMRNGRRICSGATTRNASLGWTGGLTPAAMSQAGCPDGTIATNALGHNDIVRCVPL